MSGRRSHSRYIVASPWDGAVRVLRDVIVARLEDHELVAISHAPGIVDETMTLDLLGAGASAALLVRVVESSPAIIDGAVRHRIRLRVIEAGSTTGASPAAVAESTAPATPEML